MKIETKNLILRELEETDKVSLLEHANNLNVSKYLSMVPHPYTLEDAERFINHCIQESQKKPRKNYELAIELKSKKGLIGVISLTDINLQDERAGFGYWLSEKYWRKRIMTEALKALIEFAFNELKLRRLDCEAYVENEASNNLIQKMGFRFEGVRKEFCRSKSTGEVHDQNIYGLLRKEYKP